MPLFDDPVRATVDDRPVLWLGTESISNGIFAVIVGDGGHVSAVAVNKVRAGFRFIDGEWINAEERDAAALAEALDVDPLPTAPSVNPDKYPPGTIFDSVGGAYTPDGDPLD